MNRRRLLALIGTGTVTAQAGCLVGGIGEPDGGNGNDEDGTDGDGDGTDDGENDGNGGNGDSGEPDVQPEIRDRSVETGGTDCMSDGEDGSVDVRFDADGISIDGVAVAPDPCHEATIESASVGAGELRVRVGLEDTGEVCTECVGAIRYSATVTLDGADGVDTVTVEHGEDGESYTVSRGGGD